MFGCLGVYHSYSGSRLALTVSGALLNGSTRKLWGPIDVQSVHAAGCRGAPRIAHAPSSSVANRAGEGELRHGRGKPFAAARAWMVRARQCPRDAFRSAGVLLAFDRGLRSIRA